MISSMYRVLLWTALVGVLVAFPRAETNLASLGPQVGQRALDFLRFNVLAWAWSR